MARVTIEDSLDQIESGCKFTLIRLAAYRAHQLQHGAKPLVPVNNDKPTVLALREIAAGYTDFENAEIPHKDAFGKLVFAKKRDYQND